MKLLKPWWAAGGGLLHLTLLLSLAGLREDLDLYLLWPSAALLWDELLLPGCPARRASSPSPFAHSGGWGRAGVLPPKSRELDPAAPLEGSLLREVRSLGVPFIPHTRVHAWLVHSVAAGDADRAPGLLGPAASSAVGDGSSQAAPGSGGDPRAARGSPLAATEEEKGASEPRTQVRDAGGRGSQDNQILSKKTEAVNESSQQEEIEEGVSAHKKSQQSREDEDKRADAPDWEAEIPESRNEATCTHKTIQISTFDNSSALTFRTAGS